MSIIAVFVVFFLIGDTIAFGIGAAVERFSTTAGMLVFLGLFVASAITSWYVAVYVTDRFIVRQN
jgi:hypothetical protein